jgi:hypothetical protein
MRSATPRGDSAWRYTIRMGPISIGDSPTGLSSEPRVPPQTMFGLTGITAGCALPPKSSETARPVDALFSKSRWVVAIGPLVRL